MTSRKDLLASLQEMYGKYGAEYREFNICGVLINEDSMVDRFNDFLLFGTMTNVYVLKACLKPSKYWTENPVTYKGVTGAGHLVPSKYYPDVWMYGIHGESNPNFAHKAWIQVGQFWFARDINKDGIIEPEEPIQTGYDTGFNCHRASKYNDEMSPGLYTAGCQVAQHAADFEAMTKIFEGTRMFIENHFVKIPYLLTKQNEWGNQI